MSIISLKKLVCICAVGLSVSSLSIFNASAVQNATSHTTAKRYNFMGQLTGVILPDPDGSGPLKYGATRNTYINGLLTKIELGELSSWQNETVKPENWSGFTKISQTVYTYDERGRQNSASAEDEFGNIKTFTQTNFDSFDRVNCRAVRLNPSMFGNTSADACSPTYNATYGYDRVTKYTYDNLGQVLVEYRAYGTSLQQAYKTHTYYSNQPGLLKTISDANYNTTTLEYDAWGRLDKRIYPLGTYNSYVYDLAGNLIEERKRNGAIYTYGYDGNNQRTSKSFPDSKPSVNYRYDLRGLNIAVDQGQYNDRRLIANTFDGRGNLTNTTVGEGYYGTSNAKSLDFTYDKNSNREQIEFPDGKKFNYEFDGLNRIDRLTNNEGSQILTLSYGKNGIRKTLSRAGGSVTTYNFDEINRLSSFSQGFTGSIYDMTNSFVFNPASQITDLTLGNSGYQYQGNENRDGSYSVNSLNQYTSIAGSSLGYDANGNLTNDGGTYTYVYDDENRLTSLSGDDTASFIYDAMGRLIQTTINGTETNFLYDGDALVAEYNGSGTLTKRYVHGDRVDEPWVEFVGTSTSLGNTRFLHADHQGSIIAKSNTSGNVTHTNAYDAYGLAAITNEGRFGYTGQTYFDELNLNYYKARIYHPKLGRFLQTDPVGYEDQMNLYTYVGNDPINMVDPTGEFGVAGFLIGAGIELIAQAATGNFDATDVLIAGAVGTVTGGFGGRAAMSAIKGTISASQAVRQTAAVSAAASGVGSMAQDVANGDSVSVIKAGISTVSGAAGGLVGGKVANSFAAKLDKMSNAGGVAAQISGTTRSAMVGKTAEQSTSAVTGLANKASDVGISVADKKLKENL